MLAILEYIVLGFAVELIVSVVTKNAYIEPLQRYEYENEIGIFLSRMVIFWIVLLLGYFRITEMSKRFFQYGQCLFLRAYQF